MAARNANRRSLRTGARRPGAFSLPLRLAAGMAHWDAIALRPVQGPAPRPRRAAR
jgi:hypothetical protein